VYNDNGAINQAVAIDPFNLAKLFVNYTLNNGSVFSRSKLRFAVNNLTDSHRIVSVNPESTKSNLPAPGDVLTLLPGRSVSLTLTFGFSSRSNP
jgi:iron complex outermembrane receptor protein